MRRGRIFFYLAFILILGLVAVVVVYMRFLQPSQVAQVDNITPTPVPTVNVVVVTQKVARGTVLDERVLGTIPIPEAVRVEGMFSDVNQVVGRMARFDLDSGIMIMPNMLVAEGDVPSGSGSVAALSIPPGMVAVSIGIDKLSAVSYAPWAGDHVNVIVTMSFVDLDSDFQTILPNNTGSVLAPGPAAEGGQAALTATISGGGGPQGRAEVDPVLGQSVYTIPSEQQRPRRVSQTLLQDAIVLNVGTFPLESQAQTNAAATPTPDPNAPQQENAQPTPVPARYPDTITLIVSPQDAVTLNYLLLNSEDRDAQLTLALRASGDTSRVQTEAVTLQFLLDQYRIPVPVKLPYGLDTGSVTPLIAPPTPAPANQ